MHVNTWGRVGILQRATIPSNGRVSFIRGLVERILDRLDPPERVEVPLVPCPVCSNDLSKSNKRFEVDRHYLRYYLCLCGHASAWHWNGSGPQLVYGQEPIDFDEEI